jgi:hypothetical protein
MEYKTDLIVEYSNDEEYREMVKKVCSIEATEDDEYIDFDCHEIQRTLDFIYSKTKRHPLFKCLYQKAAALFLSEDENIGVVVMFAYDYFVLFHQMFCHFLLSGELAESNTEYVKLHKLLYKK